ncbi:FG-GAP-like repeat-containing protein [Streptosporangium sp. G11]|uniref:FG-GAP-like repeat-containing protein n=1 Tax=Streptosporangium sp. G11 TaxID=3436926 RepID=UPI003EC10650
MEHTIPDFDRAAAEAAYDAVYDSREVDELLDDALSDVSLAARIPGPLPVFPGDLPGTVEITDTGFRIVIRAAEIDALELSSTDWIVVAAAGSGALAVMLFACFGAIANPFVCKGLAGAAGAVTARVVQAKLGGEDMSSTDFWESVFVAALIGGGLGVFQEAVSQFAQAFAKIIFRWIGNKILDFVIWLGSWASAGARAAATWFRDFLTEIGERLPAAIEHELHPIPPPMDLRVMPLGDSITYGQGTSDLSGYRARLSSQLADDVDSLDYVGSQQSGQLSDRDHEGHQGWTIDRISDIATCTVREFRPNVVTLHIGTNDMWRDLNVAAAHERLRNVIRKILTAAPETTVLVATLIPSTSPAVMERIQRYNAAIPGVVADFRAIGRSVHLVDMSAVGTADMADTLHPNANGFRKMGDAFDRKISDIVRNGVIWRPKAGVPGACGTPPGPAPGNPPGVGMDGWRTEGMIAAGVPGGTREEVRFADVDGDGRDDYLMVDPQGRVRAWGNNLPSPRWIEMGEVAAGVPGGTRDGLRFADLNGDGRDDYLMVDAQGGVRAWGNVLPNQRWTEWGEVAAGVPGATRDEVRFADIDGDGADDYLLVGLQGEVRAWGNNLPSPRWIERGVVASGFGATRDEVRFTDLDGDSRDDYLVVNAQGQVRAWLNATGQTGVGAWLPQAVIAAGVGTSRANVEFADVDGGGQADYLTVNASGQVWAWIGELYIGSERWDRQGVIAAGVPGGTLAELRFADLDQNRKADYLLVSPQGAVRGWGNDLPSPRWTELGQVAAGVAGATREEVRFADLDCDGRDDYLMVDPQGRVRAWGNNLPSPRWIEMGEVAAGVPGGTRDGLRFADYDGDGCDDYLMVGSQGEVRAWGNNLPSPRWTEWGQVAAGIGLHDSMITFADIDGDRRDDYLSVSGQGRIWAWRNTGSTTWPIQGEITAGLNAPRGQVFLADVNGDRRDDYLISSSTGVVSAWVNNGLTRKG